MLFGPNCTLVCTVIESRLRRVGEYLSPGGATEPRWRRLRLSPLSSQRAAWNDGARLDMMAAGPLEGRGWRLGLVLCNAARVDAHHDCDRQFRSFRSGGRPHGGRRP